MLSKYKTTFYIALKPSKANILKEAKGYDFIVIDSINNANITPEELDAIKKQRSDLSIIAIMQNTKGGKFKGSNQFLHDADIHIILENGVAKQVKSRYSEGREEIQVWK